LGKSPDFAVIAGLVLSAASVLDRVIDPAHKRAAFIQDYKRYAALKRAVQGKAAEEAEKLLAKAREDDADEIEALRDVAYNDVLKQLGRDSEYLVKLSVFQRIMAAAA
jgi:ferritin-like protein